MVSVVHQRLLEKAEVGLAEAVTAKPLSGLLSAKVSVSLRVPLDPREPKDILSLL